MFKMAESKIFTFDIIVYKLYWYFSIQKLASFTIAEFLGWEVQ